SLDSPFPSCDAHSFPAERKAVSIRASPLLKQRRQGALQRSLILFTLEGRCLKPSLLQAQNRLPLGFPLHRRSQKFLTSLLRSFAPPDLTLPTHRFASPAVRKRRHETSSPLSVCSKHSTGTGASQPT